jgi:hypothetical protein
MLPAHVQAEVQRILDREARRLLSDELDGHAVSATAGSDPSLSDHGPDESPASVERQAIPIRRGADGQNGEVAA